MSDEQPAQAAPERIWVQIPKSPDDVTVHAYKLDPREVHDNGKPVYVYVRADLAAPSDDDEIRRFQDGVRDHLISLGVPDSRIDGAGCDSGDPLDFTKAEITQAFSYFEDAAAPRAVWDAAIEVVKGEHLEEPTGSEDDVAYDLAINHAVAALEAARDAAAAGSKDLLTVGETLRILRKSPTTPLLAKIVEICDEGSAQEFGDADERLRAIRGLIIGEAV